MSGQIYNCMINDKRIAFNDKVVVYNVMKNNIVIPVIVNHLTFTPIEYTIDNLKNMLVKLFAMERNNKNMCIKTNGLKYEIFEFDRPIPVAIIQHRDIHIEEICQIICKKEINYQVDGKNFLMIIKKFFSYYYYDHTKHQ